MKPNIQLYNPHLNKYLSLVENTNFTFQAENQKQDLESYTCGYSFDVEIIIDDVLFDSLTVENYANGETYWTDGVPALNIDPIELPVFVPNRVIMIVNGVKLYSGKLVRIGGTPTTAKCSYQCLPYGAMKNFVPKPKLKDYFKNTDTSYYYMSHLFERGAYLRDLISNTGKAVELHTWNNNDYDTPLRSCVTPRSMAVGLEDNHIRYWTSFVISDFLKAIGIESFDAVTEMFVPTKLSFKKYVKARLYRAAQDGKVATMMFHPYHTYVLPYKATRTSEMWMWDETKKEWVDLNQMTVNGFINRLAFANSIRSNKSLEGMELYRIDEQGFDYNLEQVQISSDYLDNTIGFGYREGKKWNESGEALAFQSMVRIENTSTQAIINACLKAPEYIDVIFKIECDKDFQSYPDDEQISSYYWGDVPFTVLDLSFMDMTTNDFLNQLSLYSDMFSWLRNPMFVNKENKYYLYGITSNTNSIFLCDDKRLVSMRKEISTDKPSDIRIQLNLGSNTSVTKRLNNIGNATKTVEPTIVAVDYSNYYKLPKEDGTDYSTLPIMVANLEGATEFWENDILGVVGRRTDGYWYSNGVKKKCWNFKSDSTDFDFLYDYSDKSDKYIFDVVGYQFEEKMNFENQMFVVNKYSTTDFIHWELECYKLTDWDGKNTPELDVVMSSNDESN